MTERKISPFVRADVTDDEKKNIVDRAAELDMNIAQLIREGLVRMGCTIETKKAVGAPAGNKNNPGGNPNFGKEVTGALKKRE